MKKRTPIVIGIAILLAAVLLSLEVMRMRREEIDVEKGSFVIYNYSSFSASGMFAVFSGILGALDYYDQGHFRGMKVDLDDGPYLDPAHGPNWWNYFFEPIDSGDASEETYTFKVKEHLQLAHRGFHMPRHRAAELILKYVHIRPDIQEEVDAFVHAHFDNHYVVGIHHRGTDKVTEMPLIPYERTMSVLNQVIQMLTPEQKANFRIYIATDDQYFLNHFSKVYPEQVIYSDFVRSSDDTPLHLGQNGKYKSNYQKGKEALLDCLLLARCQYLIRPWSSLSIVSDHFNPDMPLATLKERHWFKRLFKSDYIPAPIRISDPTAITDPNTINES